MNPFEIKNNLYWVGAVDWNLRDFHGYSTERGTSYNAYLLRDDKTVLFDTVKSDLTETLLANLKAITELQKIDYIVVNHAEMDHTGALPILIELARPEKILCTARCRETLLAHFHLDGWPFEVVADGQTLNTGRHTIRFLDSKMLHWPESMVSCLEQDGLLISNDIFGQHWATSERFADQVEQGELYWQAMKYYANIFYPYSPAAARFLARLRDLNLSLEMLLPDHGLIWRNDLSKIMDAYQRWSTGQAARKAVVAYDTMWGSTQMMAQAVGQGLASTGISVKVMDLRFNHRSDIITEILEAKAVVVGCSVLNNGILPKMADMLNYMKGLKPTGKLGGMFGSYGWADKGVKMLREELEEMKFQVIGEGVSANYVPDSAALQKSFEYGRTIGQAVMAE